MGSRGLAVAAYLALSEAATSASFEASDGGGASGSIPRLEGEDELDHESALLFTQKFLIDEDRMYLHQFRGVCPPTRLSLDGGSAVMEGIDASTPDKEGTNSKIYFSEPGRQFALKVLGSNDGWTYAGMRREKVVLERFRGLAGAVPQLHKIDADPAILGGCKGVTMVSDFAGQFSLETIKDDVPKLMRATARVIEILRHIHSHGIVHGDIHLGNIRIADLDDVDTSTKIIDFGRAELYVVPKFTSSGAFERWVHLPRRWQVVSRNYCPTLLSVFELKGSPPARRDDMYRLAESLAFALNMGDWKKMYGKRNEFSVVLEMKMQLKIPSQPLLEEFLVEMRNLPFKARPNYEKWIGLFRT